MFNNKILKTLIFIIFILISLLLFIYFYYNKYFCYTEFKTQVDWISMQPYFKNNENISVLSWYYNCRKIKNDDFVILKNLDKQLIKQVKAIPWDTVFIDYKTNNIYINNFLLKSPNWRYIFTNSELKLISLYLNNNKLIGDVYLVFSTQITNTIDSRNLWWIYIWNIIWKVKK